MLTNTVKIFEKGYFYRRIGWDLKPFTRAWLHKLGCVNRPLRLPEKDALPMTYSVTEIRILFKYRPALK